MARARNIKPGFFRNADLVELSVETRLLFIGLWTIADRDGRLEDRPKQIKMELFPEDSVDCNVMLDSLAASGMIARYEVDGKRYLQVINFTKHQNPHRDEKASTIPAQFVDVAQTIEETEKHDASMMQAPCKDDANTMAIGLNPDSLIPDSLIPEIKDKAQAPIVIPDWIPADSWAGYLEMRRKQKKHPTRRATELVFKALQGMREKGIDISMVLDTSTRNCWTDVYEPKDGVGVKKSADAWWEPAGFDNEYEARNVGCSPSTAKFFRDGKRIAQAVA